MSNFGDHPAGFFGDSSFYNGVATQSVRFNQPSSSFLSKSVSAGTRTKSTFAWWMKRGQPSIGDNNIGEIFGFGGSGGGGSQSSARITLQANVIDISQEDNNSVTWQVITTPLLRDHSSWYHCVVVIDTTQSTAANRVKVYINGNKVTSFSTASYPSEDLNTRFGLNGVNRIGVGDSNGGAWSASYFDGYFADMYYLDGVAVSDSSSVISEFGQFKNGVWIPKEYTGSFGTNGFHFKFDQVGVGTASTSTIGADTSGNTNHYTSSGIDADGCNMPDSPENNFCTLNPLDIDENNSGAATLEGNLKWTNVNANIDSTFGFGTQGGKYYWEYLYVSSTDGNHYQGVTLQKDGISLTNAFSTGIALYFNDGTTRVDGTSGTGFGGQIGADNIIQFKLDLDNGTLQFGKNNTYIDALTLPTSVGGWRAGGIQAAGTGGTRVFVVNYGQDSSFAGTKTAQSNTDGNGNGNFFYAVPSGFLAVCSANLPEPTIGPDSSTQADDHFDTLLYTGNGSARDIGGLEFKPDWVWVKGRSYTDHHALFDSSRGVTKTLFSNGTFAESTDSDALDEFRSDGFGINGTGADLMNTNNETYVAWNWKANGGTTTTNDASATSIGSQDSVIQANTTAGFSIVLYTGTGSNDTFAHGLGVAPKWIIHKRRDSSQHWVIYHVGIGNTRSVLFNTDAQNNASAVNFNNTSPTATVFSLGTDAYANADGGTYVAYCFAEVEGYSKMGSYTGNGAVDGTFIYTGFRPAFIMSKKISDSGNWEMFDTTRDPINYSGKYILANSSDGEGDTGTNTAGHIFDIISNGFKLRNTNSDRNTSGGSYIYMAFAEAPFKYANAR